MINTQVDFDQKLKTSNRLQTVSWVICFFDVLRNCSVSTVRPICSVCIDIYRAMLCIRGVDHATLLCRLQKYYGLCGSVLGWFTSYLSGRSQYVRTSAASSIPSAVLYGVPQGSVLGPILFVLYTADVLQLVRDHDLIPHAFADDTQILGTCGPSDSEAMQNLVSDCLDDVSSWMSANQLQLNHSNTEALWCSSSRRQYQIPTRPVELAALLCS